MARLVKIGDAYVNPDNVLYARTYKGYANVDYTEILFDGISHGSHYVTKMPLRDVVRILNGEEPK